MTKEREQYLIDLAEEYGAEVQTVFALAEVLGPSEDYDGLVAELQDMAYLGCEYL